MKLVNFKVKIPIPEKNDEYKEFQFTSPKDVCKELSISESALYSICNNTFKWSHKRNKHLQGIIIERQTVYANNEEKEKLKEEKKKLKIEKKLKKEESKYKEELDLNKKKDIFNLSLINKLSK